MRFWKSRGFYKVNGEWKLRKRISEMTKWRPFIDFT